MNQLRPQLANLEARCSKEILMLESKLAQAEDRAVNAEREKASVSVEFEQEHWDLTSAGEEAQAEFRETCKTDYCNGEGPPIKGTLPRIIKTGYKVLGNRNFTRQIHDFTVTI